MSDPYGDRHAARRAEREEQRLAAQRQRRIVAVTALAVGVLIVIVVAVSALGGGGGGSSRSSSSSADRASGAKGRGDSGRGAPGPAAAPLKPVPRSKRNVPVPILMYHLINDPPPNAPLPELYVAKADFAAQMKWLKDNGYQAVTEQQVYDLWKKGTPLPGKGKPVVVSFDDGFRSIRTNAFPVLKRLGWKGVVNLQGNIFTKQDEGGMSERDVQDLVDGGWELDAHSITHPDLTTLGDAELKQEVAGVRAQLSRKFKVPVNFFCYPAGRYDERVVAAVKDAGYLGATTTNFGNAARDQLLVMNRVRINRSDGPDGFAQKMQGLDGQPAAPAPVSFGGAGGA